MGGAWSVQGDWSLISLSRLSFAPLSLSLAPLSLSLFQTLAVQVCSPIWGNLFSLQNLGTKTTSQMLQYNYEDRNVKRLLLPDLKGGLRAHPPKSSDLDLRPETLN